MHSLRVQRSTPLPLHAMSTTPVRVPLRNVQAWGEQARECRRAVNSAVMRLVFNEMPPPWRVPLLPTTSGGVVDMVVQSLQEDDFLVRIVSGQELEVSPAPPSSVPTAPPPPPSSPKRPAKAATRTPSSPP